MRAQLSAAVVSLVLISCFSGYSEDGPQSALRVRRGSLTREIVLTGELDAARGAAITVPNLPQWQSSIKWIANDGVKVAQGERVVELDNSTFTADLDSKRQTELQITQEIQQKQSEWKADLEQKQLDFDTKKSELDKAKIDASVPKEILSAREYQDRQLKLQRASVEYAKTLDILRSQKKDVEADSRNLQLRLGKAKREIGRVESAIESVVLRAPRDGIVIIRDHPWEGRKIQLGDTVWVGFPLALIPEMSSLRVSASLADVDDGRIAVGMPVSVVMDGYPDQTFNGSVASISAVAQESTRQSLRRAFKVLVDLDRVDAQRMRPGLSARLVIRTQTIPNALIVPRTALDLSSAKPRARLAGGRSVEVKLGACNAQECVVNSGLEEGQRLARADGDVNG